MAPEYSPESLESLLSDLSISEDDPDHEQILKHANNVLKSSKGNPRALHTKVVALLHLDRHNDALRVLESAEGQKISSTTVLERAYALYKVGRLEEAIAAAQESDAQGVAHIVAQANYRLERFADVYNTYKSLSGVQHEAGNGEPDLRTNTVATESQLLFAGHGNLVGKMNAPREDLDVFETTFNTACASIAKDELGRATILLKRAKDLCNELDLPEEEKKVELEPVIVQEVYVLARTGRYEQAAAAAKELDALNVADEPLKPIALNNQEAIRSRLSEYNPHSALRNVGEATLSSQNQISTRPFQFQSRLLRKNFAILDLDVGKVNAVKSAVKKYYSDHPDDKTISVLQSAAHTANHNGKDVVKKVEALFEASPKDVGIALTLVQLRMGVGNVTGAIQALEKLLGSLEPEERYQPGLIGLMVALYQHQGRKQGVRDVLTQASDYWKTSPNPSLPILRAAGKSKLDSDDPSDLEAAGQVFASLLSLDPSDRLAAAGLVASYAVIDPSKTASHAETLTAIDSLIGDIDISALESAGVAQPARKRSAEEDASRPSKAPKTRKRKPRLPKDMDPNKKIDPERWLPLRDRSYYKPKGKKDKKKAAAATQGGVVEESMELAGGLKVDVVKVDQKKGGGGGGANKKKKKKGGKW